jgi:uncharacterized membrane protein
MSKRAKGQAREGRFSPFGPRSVPLAFAVTVAVAALGGLGGGSSTAAIAEIPASCLDYEAALQKCYGPVAAKAQKPWRQVGGDRVAMASRCQRDTRRLQETCR